MKKAKIWEEWVVIPTYEVGAPDKNPMFLEKRVYQGRAFEKLGDIKEANSRFYKLLKNTHQNAGIYLKEC